MSNQDGLNPKEFEDLIKRLSQRKQENPSEQIPFQDVKDILQDEGLLESLLQEHVSSRNQDLNKSEQRRKKQFSLLLKGFGVLSILLSGLSAWGGYTLSNKLMSESANQSSAAAQNTLTSQNKELETKVGGLEEQLKTKEEQLKDLIGKVGTASSVATTPAAVASSNPSGGPLPLASKNAPNSNSSVDLGTMSVSLQGCDRSTKSVNVVKCSVNLVSKVDQTAEVGSDFYSSDPRTRVFDPQGVAYKAGIVEFGNNINTSGSRVKTALIKDVPAKATLTFNDVPPEIKNFKALEVSILSKGEKEMEWQFPQYRDITIK
jgi:hypothetical protein